MKKIILLLPVVLLCCHSLFAQQVREAAGSVVLWNGQVSITVHTANGKTDYRFSNGIILSNTIAYVEDIKAGLLTSSSYGQHRYSINHIKDSMGAGTRLTIVHIDDKHPFSLVQCIILYTGQPYALLQVKAESSRGRALPETRNISPLAVLPAEGGRFFIPGHEPRIIDIPFDNDDWVNVLSEQWPSGGSPVSGTSYEMATVYDKESWSGIVAGSVTHDCWKTGIRYTTGQAKGTLDSLVLYGGVSTKDNPALPAGHGGRDGTHDVVAHGTLRGSIVSSPLVYLCGLPDVRKAQRIYGDVNVKIAGRLYWKGYAPVYWNSFGVEGVLGYTKAMMPADVVKVSDFIHTLRHFNSYAEPVLSIDSYDQGIYTTDVLASIGRHAHTKKQRMGFYFSPFSIWTWKNAVDQTTIPGTGYQLRDVVLRDNNNTPIPYKDGDWAAYPMDPTHPATRQYIIGQLQKAKAVGATFIKIDFLTGGALESTTRYDPSVRTGMQAYNYGMKLFKQLVDSIMGPDIFITQAISPLFPHQYAHTRFISTDVYSHLRDDQPNFPGWGSTDASLCNGSHFWWVQGTLWPYTNLDVIVMKNFQKNPDLSEQEVKVRLYAMVVMGSILGDGSDYRDTIAAGRAAHFLDNKAVCAFFSQPRAFTPLQAADGESMDQQMAFYLPGDTVLLGLFNFNKEKEYKQSLALKTIGLLPEKYIIQDFMTGAAVGSIEKGQASFSLTVTVKDALLVRLAPAGKQ